MRQKFLKRRNKAKSRPKLIKKYMNFKIIPILLFQRQHLDIIVQSPCPPPNGTQVLSNFDYIRSNKPWESTEDTFLIALAIFYAVFALVAMLAFVFDCTKYVRSKEKSLKKGFKVTVNTP